MNAEHEKLVVRTVAGSPWAWRGWGNHRAIVRVDRRSDGVHVVIPWRRRDRHPDRIGLRVVRLADGYEVKNVMPLSLTRESGEIVFEANQAGRYAVYFMPFEIEAAEPWRPIVRYRPAGYENADPAWVVRAGSMARQEGGVEEIQARTETDRFDPMELIAAPDEIAAMVAKHGDRPFYVFPENRKNPIRMHDDLPVHWAQQGPSSIFCGEARPNEYYVFQIGVWARRPLRHVTAEWTALPPATMTCFNLGGTDWLGRSFSKRVDVEEGQVQALWFGMDIPESASGAFQTEIRIGANGVESQSVRVELTVKGEPLADRGDGELWRLARLHWLNSKIGLDDELPAGWPTLQIKGSSVSCLGRTVRFDDLGLPEQISSFFAPSVDRLQDSPVDILSRPVELAVRTPAGRLEWRPDGASRIRSVSSAACDVESSASTAGLRLKSSIRMEYDGHLDCRLSLTAEKACELSDLALEIPLRRQVAEFMMGLGRRGGHRPETWTYEWNLDRANHYAWLGTVNAGLHLKLKHDEDIWAISRLHGCGFPRGWYNDGRGGVELRDEGADGVLLRAFCGPRDLAAGDTVLLRFSLIVTPLKLLNLEAHWCQRYHHIMPSDLEPDPVEAQRIGATVMNQHQGGRLNPFINYPFREAAALRAATEAAHARDLKFKLYYTLRELSHKTEEIWAFRSLNGEIYPERGRTEIADQFTDKSGAKKEEKVTHAGPWLREHLVDRYVPAWHEWLPDGEIDQAIATTGLSRLHNYYLEGLSWLIREVGVDGLYLDGIGYDRQVMKRVRKVMDRARPGCLIDFHSGNNHHPDYGMGNPLALYMELMSSFDSLWMGEGFDYDNSAPDYFMTEICGIPFGLTNDMLQNGGNPWRGMIYGMTCRFGWMQGGDPRHLWAFWNSFGMAGTRMFGYWHPECPVKTDHSQVLATAYVKPDGTMLIALASWASEPVTCRLSFRDGERSRCVMAPAILGFQEAAEFGPDAAIPVEPRRGRLVVLDVGRAASPKAGAACYGERSLPDCPDLAEGIPLLRDGMECGRVKVGAGAGRLTVDIHVHDVAMARHPRRLDRSSSCELFVAADESGSPLQLVLLPAVGTASAEVRAYRKGEPVSSPSGIEWTVHPESEGYRVVVCAPLSEFGIAPSASEFRFDCAVSATEPIPNWIRTRAQLASARYPFATSDGLLQVNIGRQEAR